MSQVKPMYLSLIAIAIIATLSAPFSVMGTDLISVKRIEIIDFAVDDIDGDGIREILVLRKTAAPAGAVFADEFIIGWLPEGVNPEEYIESNQLIQLQKIFVTDLSDIRPMMIRTGDIDGDGQKEISICMFKTTEFHPIYAKRPFIYRYEEGVLVPVWLGSRLSKPFDDYIFADVNADGMDELISIETTREGKKIVSCYSWWDFGFEMLGESEVFEDIYALEKTGSSPCLIGAMVSEGGEPRNVLFRYKDRGGNDKFYNQGIMEVY